VGNPLPDDQNSFVLSIATEPQTADGGISLLSSGRIDASTGPLTVAYWRLTRSGTSIEGELIDTHVAEASAQTLYYTEQFLDPCSDRLGTVPAALAVKEGAKISGDLGTPLAELRFEGQTIDGSRVFSVTMSLSRTQ
jgi:hypothetical protein